MVSGVNPKGWREQLLLMGDGVHIALGLTVAREQANEAWSEQLSELVETSPFQPSARLGSTLVRGWILRDLRLKPLHLKTTSGSQSNIDCPLCFMWSLPINALSRFSRGLVRLLAVEWSMHSAERRASPSICSTRSAHQYLRNDHRSQATQASSGGGRFPPIACW